MRKNKYDPSFRQRDALLQVESAFPTADKGITNTDSFDLGPLTPIGIRVNEMTVNIVAPELAVEQLPDKVSLEYSLEFCDEETFTKDVTRHSCTDWVQTGSPEGTEDLFCRFRVATDTKRFVRLVCKKVGAGGNLTGQQYVLEITT